MPEFQDLLFELGTEELPPKSLKAFAESLGGSIQKLLAKAGLSHGEITVYATPRRLALWVRQVAVAQAEQLIERRGPALSAAYNPDGTPSKAAEGFARSCGVPVEALTVLRTDKGEWLALRQEVPGAAAVSLLPDLLRQSIAELPIAKRMRWGSGHAEFVRPVHWVVLLFGGAVIETEILGLATGRTTRGHRFHHPDPIELSHPAEYAAKLREDGRVIASFEARCAAIRDLAGDAAAAVGGVVRLDAGLLEEVAALVEWPVPVLGHFDARYLALPPEVLINTMQGHQKYFPVMGREGRLLPCFITFSNLDSRNPDTVRKGNERVILPRLSDAEFFWNRDRERTLESRVADLATVTFQKTLGSLLDKTRRVQRLAVRIAAAQGLETAYVERAGWLSKADLLTEMVGEFPDLQGVMGRYYALAEGEPEEVARALDEHYDPRISGGALPRSRTGQILALAEKLDTLAGLFSAGQVPTGDKDPFGLRRAALGVIRIALETELDIDLPELFDAALAQFTHPFSFEETRNLVFEFTQERLRGYFLEQGYRHDEIESVLCLRPPRPLDSELRLQAVREFRRLTAAESLAAANKRIRNILRKAEETVVANVDEAVLVDPAERRLLDAARQASEDILPLLHRRDYTAALCRLAQLREVVDVFFDRVLVMDENATLRQNRLGLLALVENLFLHIADIGRLQAQQA